MIMPETLTLDQVAALKAATPSVEKTFAEMVQDAKNAEEKEPTNVRIQD